MMNISNQTNDARKAGIGLRHPHWRAMMDLRPATGFLEIHAENFLGAVGQDVIEDLRRDYPFSVHAVGISLASAEGIDDSHLDRVSVLIERIEPIMVSDHLCWSSHNGEYFNDLLPFPYNEEALGIVAANIQKVQDRFKRPILIENISAYIQISDSTMSEGEFMKVMAERTGCGILCDVNNAYVNYLNHGVDPLAWMKGLPADAVGEIHLAGHHVNEADGETIVIDDHGSRVADAVWSLYEYAAELFPHAATLVEWDSHIPPLDILLAEAAKADAIRARLTGGRHAIAA